MTEWTEDKTREFWEGWGIAIKQIKGERIAYAFPEYPNEWYYGLPDFDLDNLFQYAVPKLTWLKIIWLRDNKYKVEVERGDKEAEAFGDDPALALRDALWQVLKKEER